MTGPGIKSTIGFFEKHKIVTAIINDWNLLPSLFMSNMDVVTFPKNGIKGFLGTAADYIHSVLLLKIF